MAHVTGGGIAGNLSRVLPNTVDAEIDTSSWPRPAIFDEVAEIGRVASDDMFQTFNMGVGFIVVVDEEHMATAQQALQLDSSVIGTIVPGTGEVLLGL